MPDGSVFTPHGVTVFSVLSETWLPAKDVADMVDMHPRTARHHLQGLVELGIAERIELFPSYRYKLAALTPDNREHFDQLARAAEAFGIEVHNYAR